MTDVQWATLLQKKTQSASKHAELTWSVDEFVAAYDDALESAEVRAAYEQVVQLDLLEDVAEEVTGPSLQLSSSSWRRRCSKPHEPAPLVDGAWPTTR
eukprot:876282-Prymnesium_polylepis.2